MKIEEGKYYRVINKYTKNPMLVQVEQRKMSNYNYHIYHKCKIIKHLKYNKDTKAFDKAPNWMRGMILLSSEAFIREVPDHEITMEMLE